MPRPPEFHTRKQGSVCLPCVGGGGTEGDGGGVRLDFVGGYRTIAFSVSAAFTPSVMACAMTAPPAQGSHFSVPSVSASIFTARSLQGWRAGHAAAPTVPRRKVHRQMQRPGRNSFLPGQNIGFYPRLPVSSRNMGVSFSLPNRSWNRWHFTRNA